MSKMLGFVTLFAASSAWAASAANGVAVLDMQGTGVDEALLPTLTEVLTVEIDALGKYKVIAGRDVQAMLGFEKQKDVVGCTDAACLAEIGGALGVDRIVQGQIGKVGNTYVVNIKLINIKTANTEGRVYETVRGEVDALIDTIRKSVGKLFAEANRDGVRAGGQPAMSHPAPAPAASAAPAPATDSSNGPATQPTSVSTQRSGRSTGAIVGSIALMAVGVGGTVVGALMVVAAKNDATCANDSTCQGGQLAAANAPTEATIANVGFIAGGACIAGGILWLALSGGSSGGNAGATAWLPAVTPTHGGLGVSWAGQF